MVPSFFSGSSSPGRCRVRAAFLVAGICVILLAMGVAPVFGVGDKIKQVGRVSRDRASLERLVGAYQQGDRLAGQKKYDQALAAYEKAIEIHPYHITTLYNCACMCAKKKDYEKAIDYLELAVKAGFVDYKQIKKDKDLKSVRRKPRYKKLFKNEKQFIATQKRLALERLKEDYGGEYKFVADDANKLIFVAHKSKNVLDKLKKSILDFAKYLWKHLLTKKPDYYIAIVLLEPGDFSQCVPSPKVVGQYNHKTKTLVSRSLDLEYGGFMRHEFTHALHYADSAKRHDGAKHPIWVREGLATMYEYSKFEGGDYVPKPNFRISDYRIMTSRGRKVPLSRFIRTDDSDWLAGMRDGTTNLYYGMCRYLMIYIHEKGLLKAFYKAYTASFKKDPAGKKALEKVFGKGIDQIDSDWRAWLKKQPNSRAQAG